MMKNSISNFFYPNSVCVVGASSKEKSIGYEILKSIKTYNYSGNVFPVNPKTTEILGYNCFSSIQKIQEKIDLAFVVVAKQFVMDSVTELIAKNVKSIVVVTAGFKETGEEGKLAEMELLQLARKHNVRLVGPNCMGIINANSKIRLNATFVAEKPEYEAVGFLSQSGALGAAVINSLRETDIRFAHFISVGNKADINEIDLLKFWENDKSIKISTFYLESFVDGFSFIEFFILGKSNKPTLILKAGKSQAGMKAASSHTGALGTEDRVVNSVMKQFGIIRSDTITQMFNSVKGFLNFPKPKGNRIAVVTNAGGPAILAVDSLEKNGLILAELSQKTIDRLEKVVPKEGAKGNPIDLLPGGTWEMYKLANEIVLKDENVDAIISIFVEPVMVEPLSVVESVNSIKSQKPIFQVVMPLPEFWSNYKQNSQFGTPIFRNPEEPAKIISDLLLHFDRKLKIQLNKEEYQKQRILLDSKMLKGKDFLNDLELQKIVNKYKLPISNGIVIPNKEILSTKIENYPIVIKGINSQTTHKSDFGAVELNIKNEKELITAVKSIKERMQNHHLIPESFLIQPFHKGRFELLIGGFRDSSFGPMITFGLGGKYVNYFEDFAMRSAFVTSDEIREMIFETKIGAILKGVRGESPIEIDHLISIISNSCKMLRENKNLLEFDINPLIVTENNELVIVDFRIKLS